MNFRLRPGPGDEKRVKKEMNKIGKRAIPILVIAILAMSFVLTVNAAGIAITAVKDKNDVTMTGGSKGDLVKVFGSGVTAGATVGVYWDNVLKETFSDGTGKLNATEAGPDGTFELWFKVPEAVKGTHYIWVRDSLTGTTYGGYGVPNSPFEVITKLKLSPSTGLVGDTITLNGYGYSKEKLVTIVGDVTITPSPTTPKSSALGTWTATFRVVSGLTSITATDAGGASATTGFTIGPSIKLTPESGPVGKVVVVEGRGFTYDEVVTIKLGTTECYVINGPIKVKSGGTFKLSIVIPQVGAIGDYVIYATAPSNSSQADFEVLGLAKVKVDPSYGPQGSQITVKGYNFTQISGTNVDVTVTGVGLKTFKTDSKGEFTVTYTIPAVASGTATLTAAQTPYHISADKEIKVGIMLVLLSPTSGPSGTIVSITGVGFTDGGYWNATLNGVAVTDPALGPIGAQGTIQGTFFVPTVDPETYTLTVLDIDPEIEVTAEFTVTAKTRLTPDPLMAPNDYTIKLKGKYFSAENETRLSFVIWNATDDWDMTVIDGGIAIVTDEDGNFTGYWDVPSNETLSIGNYWINCTDENDLFAQAAFSVVPKTVQITPRKAVFRIGETVSFIIESSFALDNSYIEVSDPSGNLYWQTDPFKPEYWVKVGTIERVPYYQQTAGGNPMLLLDDAPLGTWSWTWYDSEDDELDSGTFTVQPAPEEVITSRLDDIESSLTDVKDDISGVKDDIAGVKSDLQDVADAADAARQAAQNAQDAVTSIGETANSAKDSADAAKAAAEDAKSAASGLTTLVYGAIGASLVAALAAIVSLMQISRRIAG